MHVDYRQLLEDARRRKDIATEIMDSIDVENALMKLKEIDPIKETPLYALLVLIQTSALHQSAVDLAQTMLDYAKRDIPILEEYVKEQTKQEAADELSAFKAAK